MIGVGRLTCFELVDGLLSGEVGRFVLCVMVVTGDGDDGDKSVEWRVEMKMMMKKKEDFGELKEDGGEPTYIENHTHTLRIYPITYMTILSL